MSESSRDQAAFEATLAAMQLTVADSLPLDATVVPDQVATWTSFHDAAPLPSISVQYSVPGERAEAPAKAELEIHELLGQGGMGQVYRAVQRSLGREVAVKTLRDSSSGRAIAALCDEAVVTGRLSHPNVIPVHALGDAGDGRPLLVLKRVKGVGWNVLLAPGEHEFWARNKISVEDRQAFHLEVLRKVTHAVAFAHSQGILHRDIKPENVMIGDFGEVYLVDWGLAVKPGTSTAGSLAGTPMYLAPEMLGETVDARTDVYLLGATLFEILTGAPPHRGASLADVLHAVFLSEPPTFSPEVPAELADLCTRSLARDPAARPQTADAFGAGLDDHVRHRGSRALARTAEQRLAQLRHAIEGAPPQARDLGEVRRLIAEARFAFQEARRGWADNPSVAPGLDATLQLAVRAELDRRDGEAARAMLAEIEHPPPELTRAVEVLEAELQREAAEHARLQKLAHDLDPEVERGVRFAGAAVVLGMMLTMTFYVRSVGTLTPRSLFVLSLLMFAGLFTMLLVMWRRIMRTLFNRRLAAWVAVSITVLVAHRSLALFDPAATSATILPVDLVLLGGAWAWGSLFLFRFMLPVGIALGACAIPGMAAPSVLPALFSGANALAIASLFIGWRSKRPAEQTR